MEPQGCGIKDSCSLLSRQFPEVWLARAGRSPCPSTHHGEEIVPNVVLGAGLGRILPALFPSKSWRSPFWGPPAWHPGILLLLLRALVPKSSFSATPGLATYQTPGLRWCQRSSFPRQIKWVELHSPYQQKHDLTCLTDVRNRDQALFKHGLQPIIAK
jgi:hypothetical protein